MHSPISSVFSTRFNYASARPNDLQASSAASSGALFAVTLSVTIFAPAARARSSQSRIHCPSPQPYEPKSAIFHFAMRMLAYANLCIRKYSPFSSLSLFMYQIGHTLKSKCYSGSVMEHCRSCRSYQSGYTH